MIFLEVVKTLEWSNPMPINDEFDLFVHSTVRNLKQNSSAVEYAFNKEQVDAIVSELKKLKINVVITKEDWYYTIRRYKNYEKNKC